MSRVRRRLVCASSRTGAGFLTLLQRWMFRPAAGSVRACARARQPAGRDLGGGVQKAEGEIRRKALFQELNYRFVINLDLRREQ